jgi:3-methyladenine DNA glycosylase/8-oxoguanine DNA glycosylase
VLTGKPQLKRLRRRASARDAVTLHVTAPLAASADAAGDAHVPTPSARELEPLGEPYLAYRTVLTWYCWRAAELRAGAAASAVTT